MRGSSTAKSSSTRSKPARSPRQTKFGIDSVQRPYPIFQQGGSYFSTPDFLNSAHTIDTAADAEAYLSRLAQFAARARQ